MHIIKMTMKRAGAIDKYLHVSLVAKASLSVSGGRTKTLRDPATTDSWTIIYVIAKTGPIYFSGRYSWMYLCIGGLVAPIPNVATKLPNSNMLKLSS